MQQLQDILLKPLHKRAISKLTSTTAAIHCFPSILRSGLWNSNIKKFIKYFQIQNMFICEMICNTKTPLYY